MPIWSIIYINVFAAIVIVNSVFWLQIKQKKILVSYQLSSGFYLVYLMIAYWNSDILAELSIYNVPGIITIIIVDIYISVWVKKKVDILKLMPNLEPELVDIARQFAVIEIAKAFSLLLYAPTYIISSLVAIRIIKNTF